MHSEVDYSNNTVAELKRIAKENNITGYSSMNKVQLIKALSE
ncbi:MULTISPECIES: Rho termination factor N-terminal domain-containing protein [Clostridium]|nr:MULTISPECIES: Rho termination factor N-terminal domain-containing protein [Clostridium]MDU2108455.1 Rho termination factor N-terminal domain-containing protein [Clostridium sp.]MDU3354129.1 Rho termination factor N-terminal domain-containing protein [Clostridium sp.]